MRRDLPFSEEIDERLNEWGYFFRDRKRLETCKSIEHRYKPHSDDYAKEGWGNIETPPKSSPARSYRLLRALETHEAIGTLDIKYRWGLTYAFCYPGLTRHLVLRMLKKHTGRRFTWAGYLELVDLGRLRVHAVLLNSGQKGA